MSEFFAAGGRASLDNPAAAAGLGLRLLEHAIGSGDRAGLDRGIDLLRRAVNAAPGHESLAEWLSALPTALLIRYEQAGTRADLDEAVAAAREAVRLTPADHPGRTALLANLAAALARRYERTGAPRDPG